MTKLEELLLDYIDRAPWEQCGYHYEMGEDKIFTIGKLVIDEPALFFSATVRINNLNVLMGFWMRRKLLHALVEKCRRAELLQYFRNEAHVIGILEQK